MAEPQIARERISGTASCVMANTLPDNPRLPLIQLAYDERFLPSVFKLYRLITHSCSPSETTRETQAAIITKCVHPFIKYIAYYSIMKLARKTRRQIMQLSGIEEISDIWKSYLDRVAELEEAHDTYKMNPPAICDAENVGFPKSSSFSFAYSVATIVSKSADDTRHIDGLRWLRIRYLYCSRDCQRKDWLAGHRERCLEIRISATTNNGYPDAAYSRDRHFPPDAHAAVHRRVQKRGSRHGSLRRLYTAQGRSNIGGPREVIAVQSRTWMI
ncbi:hypothetical protein BDZ89DRAFT_299264 [Hymenopellis radicata]|nr:hypothetical protein BDZ89DRAFT_299264 [Hymenopellis radicata]